MLKSLVVSSFTVSSVVSKPLFGLKDSLWKPAKHLGVCSYATSLVLDLSKSKEVIHLPFCIRTKRDILLTVV